MEENKYDAFRRLAKCWITTHFSSIEIAFVCYGGGRGGEGFSSVEVNKALNVVYNIWSIHGMKGIRRAKIKQNKCFFHGYLLRMH